MSSNDVKPTRIIIIIIITSNSSSSSSSSSRVRLKSRQDTAFRPRVTV